MTDREKLIELLNEAGQRCGDIECYDGEECEYAGEINGCMAFIADHLLANGVVVREKGEWEPALDKQGEQREEEIFARVWRCPVCGEEEFYGNFCSECGSDMRKGENG
jgi:hypothetical protein